MRLHCVILGFLLLGIPGQSLAVELVPIPDDQAQLYAATMALSVGQIKDLPVEVKPDAKNAAGLLNEEQRLGVMVVPARDLAQNGNPENPALDDDKGLPVGILLLYNLYPESQNDPAKFFGVQFTDPQGSDHQITVALLTVCRLEGDEYRLRLWGKGDEPLAEAGLSEAGAGEKVVELDYSDDALRMTWLGVYDCTLPVNAVSP